MLPAYRSIHRGIRHVAASLDTAAMQLGEFLMPAPDIRIAGEFSLDAAMLCALAVIYLVLKAHDSALTRYTSGSLPGCQGRLAC